MEKKKVKKKRAVFSGKTVAEDLTGKVTFGQRYERVMRYLGWRDLQAERKACAKALRQEKE